MSEDGIGEAYAERGFVRVAGTLDSNGIAMLRREWSRLWNETSSDHPSVQWRGHVEQGSIADRLDPAFPLSNELYALCRDPRLIELAERHSVGPRHFSRTSSSPKAAERMATAFIRTGPIGSGLERRPTKW